jgi:hypothetical protein
MRTMLSLMAVAGILAAPAAQAQQAGVFTPTGDWIADYGDDYCRLVRTFSDGKDELSLALERLQPGTDVRMIFVGKGITPFRGADQITYQFGPSGAVLKSGYVRSAAADSAQYIGFNPVMLSPPSFGPPGSAPAPGAEAPPPAFDPSLPFVPPPYNRTAELDAARGITSISLTDGLTSPVRIDTGGLRAPIAALQACADDLLAFWGLDPDKHKTMTAPVALNPRSDGVLPQGTIPFTEFSKLAGSANQVRLSIGADGKPTACSVYSPALSETLNSRICNLAMERATFVPAKDSGGQAMASVWMGSPMFLGPPFPGMRR